MLRDIARPDGHAGNVVLTRGGPAPRVLVCLESRSPHLGARPARAAAPPRPRRRRRRRPGRRHRPAAGGSVDGVDRARARTSSPSTPARGAVVLSTGHYLPARARSRTGPPSPGRFLTVQHGLLTPHAPPLGAGTILLAWSEADAAFWRSGRDDVGSVVVGSQLLWEAAEPPPATADPDARPVFLGQLHGAELPRDVLAEAAETFCRAEHADLPAAPLRARPPLGGDARPLGGGGHRHRPFRHPAARAGRPGRQRVLHRRARGRSGRAPRVGHPGRPAVLAARSSGTATASRRGVARRRHPPNGPRWSRPAPSPRSCGG